jgi:hypothetical protein
MMGGRAGQALADPAAATGGDTASPWGAAGGGSDDLARQLGRDDIGGGRAGYADGQEGQGMLSEASGQFDSDPFAADALDDTGFDLDSGGDFGGDIGGSD